MTHEITDADIQFNLMQSELITQLAAANARIAELETQLGLAQSRYAHLFELRAYEKELNVALEAQLAAHPVTDDYGQVQP